MPGVVASKLVELDYRIFPFDEWRYRRPLDIDHDDLVAELVHH
jgi:hypothetical protein